MSEDAAILAQFSDWRTVKGRKVLQLIFEVPLEDQAKVLTHLGAPMPTADLWCGIARVPRKGKAGGKAASGPDQPGVEVASSPTPATNSVCECGHDEASHRPAFIGCLICKCQMFQATNSVTLVEGETGGAPRALTAAPPVSKSKRRWSEMPPSQRAALRVKEREFWNYITEAHGVQCFTEATADDWLKKQLDVDSKSKITGPVAHHFDLIDGKYQAWLQARQHGVI